MICNCENIIWICENLKESEYCKILSFEVARIKLDVLNIIEWFKNINSPQITRKNIKKFIKWQIYFKIVIIID